MLTSMIRISTTALAAPCGQLRASRNCSTSALPIEKDAPVAEDRRHDVLAHHRDEDEDAAGDEPGQGDRQRDLAEGRQASRAEVLRRLDERPIHPLEGHVEREDHERQVAVDDADQDRHRRPEDAECRVPDGIPDHARQAVRSEDREPRVRADQEARPERDDEQDDEQRLAATRPGRDEIGERQADEQAEDRAGEGQRQAGDERRGVLERVGVVVERESAGVAAGLGPFAEAEQDDDSRSARRAGRGTTGSPAGAGGRSARPRPNDRRGRPGEPALPPSWSSPVALPGRSSRCST